MDNQLLTQTQEELKPQPKFKAVWPIFWLIVFMLLVTVIGRLFKVVEIKTAEASELYTQVAPLKEQNEALKAKLEGSSKIVTPENTKELVRYYIKKYFPPYAVARAEKIVTCESNMNPIVVNHNKNKTADRGVWQINQVHAKRFESMYGIKWEIGAHDLDLSTKYAEYLWGHQGFNPWICSRLLGGI